MFCGVFNLPEEKVKKLSTENRYYGIAWTSVWGDFGAKSIFDTIDNINPGDTIDYTTWQKLMYANKLLAKHYEWFKYFDDIKNLKFGITADWNPITEEFVYKDVSNPQNVSTSYNEIIKNK